MHNHRVNGDAAIADDTEITQGHFAGFGVDLDFRGGGATSNGATMEDLMNGTILIPRRRPRVCASA
jgi:hypothetical protein